MTTAQLTRKSQKLQAIASELQAALELIDAFDGKELTMHRLICVHEATQILGGGKAAIGDILTLCGRFKKRLGVIEPSTT